MNLEQIINEVIRDFNHIRRSALMNATEDQLIKISIKIEELKEYKPKVKPLEWHKSGDCEYAYCLIDSKNDIEMVYEVSKMHEQSYKQGYSLCTPTDDDHTVYSTEHEAKLAAQAHFEKFILGWLEL